MTISSVEKPRFHIDWHCVQKLVKQGGALAFAFAMGGRLVSIRAEEGQLAYRAAATQKFERVQAVAGPNPVAQVKCLTKKADKAEQVAEDAVAVSSFQAVPEAALGAIPDCPPAPPAAKK